MIVAAVLVSVLVDGNPVQGSVSALLSDGTVVAPIAPYVENIADHITPDAAGKRFVFERAGRTFAVELGSLVASCRGVPESLPIAPYLRSGDPIIPLAAVARGLGAEVTYDGVSRTLDIELPAPVPLTPVTPDPFWAPPPSVAPTATLRPHTDPEITPLPRPRRTPIVLVGPTLRGSLAW